MINTMTNKVPRFLTQKMDAHHRDVAEKAAGMFCREAKLTPKVFKHLGVRIQALYPYLCEFDRAWCSIDMSQMITTPPRTLVCDMSAYIGTWKKNATAVQKVIDNLPDLTEMSVNTDQVPKCDQTDSDDDLTGYEEVK